MASIERVQKEMERKSGSVWGMEYDGAIESSKMVLEKYLSGSAWFALFGEEKPKKSGPESRD